MVTDINGVNFYYLISLLNKRETVINGCMVITINVRLP